MNCHRTYSLENGPEGFRVRVTGRPLDDGIDRAQPTKPVAAPVAAPAQRRQPAPPVQIGPLDC